MPAAKIPQIGDLFLGRLENAGKIANVLVLVDPKLEGFPQLTFTPLTTTDLVFVTSPDDPLTKRKKITWDDLAEARWILNQEGCQYCSYIKRRFEERRPAHADRGGIHRLGTAKEAEPVRTGCRPLAEPVCEEHRILASSQLR